nr:WAT1-related protein At1g25270-like [Ipomoea batatas]GMD10065.1 WAT1-related protein At1g25270-like [Ipomoea batatas]
MSMGTVQSFVYSVCTVRDWNEWKLGWNVRLFVVAYAGIVGSGLMFSLIAWCVRKKGPVFVSIFNPLMLIMVAIAGSLFLDEKIHLGTYFAWRGTNRDRSVRCIVGERERGRSEPIGTGGQRRRQGKSG